MSRVDTLQSFIAQNPADPFPRYALALEYKNAGRLEEAWSTFEGLLKEAPDYTPAYLHAGNTLVAMGRLPEARRTYRTGIDACGRKGDVHAGGELEAALGSLVTAAGG